MPEMLGIYRSLWFNGESLPTAAFGPPAAIPPREGPIAMLRDSRLFALVCCAVLLAAGGESRNAWGQSSPKGAPASDAGALPPAAETKVDFSQIEPILRKNCFSCH